MTILETAKSWVKQGYSVIPIIYRDKRPDARHLENHEWGMYQTRLPTNTELEIWFPSRLRNIALITGWHNLVVVDFDNWDAFVCWYQIFPLRTYMVKTSRGMHVYLNVVQNPANYHGEYLDIKAAGGYVLIPPSIHPSGFEYQVWQDAPIMSVEQLSMVVPAELMPVREAAPVIVPAPVAVGPDDPWEAAEQASELDQHVVDAIRTRNLLDFFPDATRKGRDDRWWVARCPFHDDKSPSFWIDTRRSICGCYAGCFEKPLDIINLYAHLHGISNRDAIFCLAKEL